MRQVAPDPAPLAGLVEDVETSFRGERATA